MPEVVISDTSCLILLKKIDELPLLRECYQRVLITDVIAAEFGEPLPAWIVIRNANDNNVIRMLRQLVDPGEASAFALAFEVNESV